MSTVLASAIVQVITIDARPNLDPIDVIFLDNEVRGKGRVIVRCYWQSWTAYWGAMGDHDVRSFFLTAGPDYIAGNLVAGTSGLQLAKKRDLQLAYVTRIVHAIQHALRATGAAQ